LRGEKAPTAASLREALAAAEAERAEAVASLDRLQARRAELLLDDDERALDVIEADIRSAQRQVDRIDLLSIQAQERLRAAAEAERRAELDRIHAEAESALKAGVRIYAKEWPPLAHRLRELALEVQRLQDGIDAANQQLLKAGDPRQVAGIDWTARPSPPDQQLRGPDLTHGLRLPSATSPWRNFYPNTDAWGQPLAENERPER
jgi:hypothetical protein